MNQDPFADGVDLSPIAWPGCRRSVATVLSYLREIEAERSPVLAYQERRRAESTGPELALVSA